MNLNKHESFEIINEMINSSRQKMNASGFFFLLWGWTILAASLIQYVLFKLGVERHYLPWPTLTIAASIVHFIYAAQLTKKVTTKTYLDEFFKVMWLCIWCGLTVGFPLAVYMANFRTAYMVVILVYSLGSCITGVLLKFKPLILGAIISVICCINLAFVAFPEALLLLAVSILFTYVIPGHILKRRNNGI